MDYIKEIATAMSANHAAVMVGAGFSKNADKISSTDKWFKNWNELADMFYDTIYDSNDHNKDYSSPLRLAQEVEVSVGRPKLESILKSAVPDEDYAPSDLHIKLLRLPWRDVFTTNYDTLLERAADQVFEKRYNTVINQEDIVNSNDAPRILKLHGSFPSQRPFIITEEDYRTYPIKFAAMVNTVQQALLENVFCMIGFSCDDPNFLSWIGWIHDNLGKSNSQKSYMISVTHVSESKQKLLYDKNILVVDLQSIYPDEEIYGRLDHFFDDLKELIEENSKKNQWYLLENVKISMEDSYIKKTEKLKTLNDSYPGWIFLPWKMKYKVDRVLDELNEERYFFRRKEKFEDIAFELKVDYMYEYVRFLNIVGRPIIAQTTKMFWESLCEGNKDEEHKRYKIQYICLQLLRSYRELADWETYDLCRNRIQDSLLKYEDRQFLFACDWWMSLYRFKDVNLMDMLNTWNLAQGDIYWLMIKSSMYAMLGDSAKAEQILTEILPKIRHQLIKSSEDEYLCSIEESVVSLLNVIRDGKFQLNNYSNHESCIQKADFTWWGENERYCWNLNKKENKKAETEVCVHFDFSVTYKIYSGWDNSKIFCALDYMRFLEQTGHSFRIGIVTNIKGLQSVIENLCAYYPHWCLMQILISQNDENLIYLFGRNQLSEMLQSEVNKYLVEYLSALRVIEKNIKPENTSCVESVYDHSAKVLPEVISRLCFKCSTNMLDQALLQMLKLCNSNIRDNFKGIDKILKGVCRAYTTNEQKERINTILKFPIKTEDKCYYEDPVNYLQIPDEKYKLQNDVYCTAISQIKFMMESGTEQDKYNALQRLLAIVQIVCTNNCDKEYLYKCLEDKKDCKCQNILYQLNKERYKMNKDVVLNNVLQIMENDCTIECFSGHSWSYMELVEILPDFVSEEINYQKVFLIMTNLVQACEYWGKNSHTKLQADERIEGVYRIAVDMLLLKIKENKRMNSNEEMQIEAYFKALQEYYESIYVLPFIEHILMQHEEFDEDMRKIWLCSEKDIKLLRLFYFECNRMQFNITEKAQLYDFSKVIYQIVVYKIINVSTDYLFLPLQLLYALVINDILTENDTQVLILNFPRLLQDTKIKKEDSEEIALYKLKCRREICIIAKEFYIRGRREDEILEWKNITNDQEEFVEIRNIEFD